MSGEVEIIRDRLRAVLAAAGPVASPERACPTCHGRGVVTRLRPSMTSSRTPVTAEEGMAEVRRRIAALVKAHPDDSHGEGWVNHGLESALRVVDYAMDAPCRFRPRAYGQWCDLHSSPVADERPIVDGRCPGYAYVKDRAIPSEVPA